MEPDHRSALCPDQVGHGDADRPAELARLSHDLIGGVLRARAADLRDGLHRLHGLEQLHADGDRAQAQVLIQAVDERRPVIGRHVLTIPLAGVLVHLAGSGSPPRTVLRRALPFLRRTARARRPPWDGVICSTTIPAGDRWRGAGAWWVGRPRLAAGQAETAAAPAAMAASDPRRARARWTPDHAARRARPRARSDARRARSLPRDLPVAAPATASPPAR